MFVQTRFFPSLITELLDEEGCFTITSKDQHTVEKSIRKCYDRFESLVTLDATLPHIYRTEHLRYCEAALRQLSSSYECLDSSRPWLVYWILNASAVLGHRFDAELLDQVVTFLGHCRSAETGGFAGGPGQLSHLAPTYAAVNALCIIGTERALHAIQRRTLRDFLWSVREESGAFTMHVGGESDIRGVYCAVAVAKLAGFSAADMRRLFKGTVAWIGSCQTYEGGIGGVPGLEAHGGYTFCGVAALALLGSTGGCDLGALLRWCVNRQMRYEGGFQGRTNKLVDGCYSFWQGACMPIVQALLFSDVQAELRQQQQQTEKQSEQNNSEQPDSPTSGKAKLGGREESYRSMLKHPLYCRGALQEYVLICCQRPTGGLIDKPGKAQDLYHTCYCLSGLAIAQHCKLDMYPLVLGNADNEVAATHPLYNIPAQSVLGAAQHFQLHNYDLYEDDEDDGDENADDEDDDAKTPAGEHAKEEHAFEYESKNGDAAAAGRPKATNVAANVAANRERCGSSVSSTATSSVTDATTNTSTSTTTNSVTNTATTTATSVDCTTTEDEEDDDDELELASN